MESLNLDGLAYFLGNEVLRTYLAPDVLAVLGSLNLDLLAGFLSSGSFDFLAHLLRYFDSDVFADFLAYLEPALLERTLGYHLRFLDNLRHYTGLEDITAFPGLCITQRFGRRGN